MAEDISSEYNSSFLFNVTGSGVQETGGFCGIRATLLALSLYSWPLNLTYWRESLALGVTNGNQTVFRQSGQSLKVVSKIVNWDMK